MFYILNIILPCIMLSILQLCVFLAPPPSGEKISLSITVLLSFTVFLLIVSESMPQTSLNVPLLGKYTYVINVKDHSHQRKRTWLCFNRFSRRNWFEVLLSKLSTFFWSNVAFRLMWMELNTRFLAQFDRNFCHGKRLLRTGHLGLF